LSTKNYNILVGNDGTNVSLLGRDCNIFLAGVLVKCICLTGETDDASIRALRSRQMKNFHLALMMSQVHI